MIPEGCETNTESGTIRDRQHSLVTKPTKPTKTFASTGLAKAKAQHSPNKNPIVLPDPEYRNVAGHVTRRQNAVRAEAPPTNTSRASSNLQNRRANWNEKRRRRTRNYDDDNSSGSDSDDRKEKQGDGGPSLKPRRQRTEPVEASHSGPSSLETEEKERLAIQKVLRRVSETWESVGWQRKQYQSQGSYRKRKLIQHHERDQGRRHRDLLRSLEGTHGAPREQALEDFKASSEDPATNTYFLGVSSKQLHNLRSYLDNALYHDIAEKVKDDATSSTPLKYLNVVLQRVEHTVIQRCTYFDESRRNWGSPAPKIPQRLISIISSLQRIIWRNILQQDPSPTDIAGEIRALLADNKFFTGQTGRLGVDIMTDAYLEKIIQDVAGAMRHDLAAGRKSPRTDGLSIPQIIRNSRHPNGPFTKEYMDWASVGIDPADVERACAELQQKAKSSRVQEFRDTMEDAKMPVEQIFIPDAIKDGKVSLVLFKGDYPSTVVEVDPEDLESMGWMYDFRKRTYWHLEKYMDRLGGLSSYQETVFKVSIDGEVWSMLAPNGEWLDWDSINAGDHVIVGTDDQHRKYSVPIA